MTMRGRIAVVTGIVMVTLLAGFGGALLAGAGDSGELRFHDVREQTEEFMRYHREIRLTDEQQQVMDEALGPLPAPCCRDRSAATCCCSCNMARSWWGLTKHLIADRGLGAEEARAKVAQWIEFIHPNGYAGDACYRGRCGRPFRDDGCGGMTDGTVVY